MATPENYSHTVGDQIKFKGTVKKKSDSNAVDLTGFEVTFRYVTNDLTETTAAATISDAANGIVEYQLAAPGLPGAGLMEYEWLIDDGVNPIIGGDANGAPFTLMVREKV